MSFDCNFLYVDNGDETYTTVKRQLKTTINGETGSIKEEEHFDLTMGSVVDLVCNRKKRRVMDGSSSSTDSSSEKRPGCSHKVYLEHKVLDKYPPKPIKGLCRKGFFYEYGTNGSIYTLWDNFSFIEEIKIPDPNGDNPQDDHSIISCLTFDEDEAAFKCLGCTDKGCVECYQWSYRNK
jgi:hypothetical protein